IYGPPTWAHGWPHLPIPHLREGLFFPAEARPLKNQRVDHASVGSNRNVKQNRPLVLGLTRFVGIFRLRAVDALRRTDAVDAGAESPAARPATFAGTKSSPGAASDARAIAIPERIGDALGQRIAEV